MKPAEPVSEEAVPEPVSEEAVEPPVEPAAPPSVLPEQETPKLSQSEEMLHLLIGMGVYLAFAAWLWSVLSDRAIQLF